MPGLLHTDPQGVVPRRSGGQLREGFTIQARDVCIDHGDIEPIKVGTAIKTDAGDICSLWECSDDFACWPNEVSLACGRIGGSNPMVVATDVPGFNFPVYADSDSVCAENWSRLGVPCPNTAPTIGGATGACGPCDAPASYVYTYVNADGHEGPPSPASAQVMVNDTGGATISGFASPPTGYNVTTIRVYRTLSQGVAADAPGQPGHGWFLVDEVAVGGTATDGGVGEGCDMLVSQTWIEPPADLTCIAEGQQGSLAGTMASDPFMLLISEPGVPHAWPGDFDLCLKDEIRAIVEYDRDWYVLTDGHPYYIQVTRTATGPSYTVYRHTESLPI